MISSFFRLMQLLIISFLIFLAILGSAIHIWSKKLIQTRFESQSYVQDVILVDKKFSQPLSDLFILNQKFYFTLSTPIAFNLQYFPHFTSLK